MSRVVIGVIGHVDHGKTALVRALTGQETDRLPEEKERGISIALGFANLQAAPGVEVDLIDMPGHERFVRTMIAGATGIDAVLLAVAANEGIQPQTVEHADIAALLGIRHAIVAVTKSDSATAEEAKHVVDAASELVAGHGLTAPRPILTSALAGQGIDILRQAVAAIAAGRRTRSADGLLYLPVDRAFSIVGHGPVVTGTLRGSIVTAGDTLQLLPLGRQVRVRSVQVHGDKVPVAYPGQRVALNLRDVEISELRRGMALTAPDALIASEWLTATIRALADAPPLKNGMRLRALFGTQDIEVRLRLLDRDVLEPGASGLAQLKCGEPVAVPTGEHVILRVASPARTVAGGKLIETVVGRKRRNQPALLKRLEELATLAPAALLASEVRRAGAKGTDLHRLSQLTSLSRDRVAQLLQAQSILVAKSGLVVALDAMNRIQAKLRSLIASHPDGLSEDRLREETPHIGPAVFQEALARLLARREVAKRSSHYVVPCADQDHARAVGEAQLSARIAELLRSSGLTPPRPSEIVVDPASRRAVDRLIREGAVVRAVDRAKGKEILFHRDAIDEAKRRLAPLLEGGEGLLPAEICAALDISRKYGMPLLNHLDTSRFTRRVGDRRLLWSVTP